MTAHDASTLVEALRATAARFPARGFTYPAQRVVLSYEELLAQSELVARRLAARGLRPGQFVGILLATGPAFITSLFGIQRAGGVPVPLAAMTGKALAGQLERLGPILRDGSIAWLIVDPQLLDPGETERRQGELRIVSGDALVARVGDAQGREPIEPSPGDVAFIQYTSGSTSAPKGVTITHANAIAGLRSIVASGGFNSDDVFCAWLPHYHDMGLVGVLLVSLFNGCQAHLSSPFSFIKDPAQWMAYFSQVRATIYTGPNFSYAYLCDALDADHVAALDLSCVRLAVNGAEAIDARLMDRFAGKFAAAGLRRSALYPVYGLAEVVLAATFPEVGEPVHVDWVDRAALGRDRMVVRVDPAALGARGVVAVGRPVDGLQLRIAGESGQALADDQVGEIQLRGDAVMRGYHNHPALTAALFQDGWLRTGDLGYVNAGRLHVVGRSKEVLKHAGESYYPEDIEVAVRGIDGVYRGGCAAFVGGPLGEERIICLAETTATDPEALARLADEIGKAVRRSVGLASLEIRLVRRGGIARTTSGKLQRHLMKQNSENPTDPSLRYQVRL